MILDLNADLGEGSGHDAAMLAIVTSANVSCGFHAGDAETVRATLEDAARRGVVVGAHPGYEDREHFGRREQILTEKQVATRLFHQVGALTGLARICRVELRYLKLHGALYHQATRDHVYARPAVAVAFLNNFQVLGLPGSELATACDKVAVPFVAEGFLDRRYRADGSLVPRSESDAMMSDVNESVEQVLQLASRGVRSVCIHGDTPGAVEFAIEAKAKLGERGVQFRAFA
jgi:5-oxoprolinase (ATP-hydrolysing) subunit A